MGGGPSVNIPGPSEEEKALQAKQLEIAEQNQQILLKQLREQQLLAPFLFSRAGLIPELNEAGEIIGFSEDPDSPFAKQQELSSLFFEQELEQFPQKQKILDLQLGLLEDQLEAEETLGPLRLETEELALERQASALKGELPLPEGLEEQFARDEATLRESLRQQLGPGFESSTAGIQALEEFRRNKEIVFDSARRAEITGIQGVTSSKQALAQGTVGGTFGRAESSNAFIKNIQAGNPVGSFLSNVAGVNALPGQVVQGLGGVGTSVANLTNQLAQERQFQSSLKLQGALGGGGGGIGSTVGSIFGGLGQLGVGAASLIALSSRQFKEDIKELKPSDLEALLEKIENMPIYEWQYKGSTKRHIGPVTEEAPKEITDDRQLALINVDCFGILFASVKVMAAEIYRLREKIEEISPTMN